MATSTRELALDTTEAPQPLRRPRRRSVLPAGTAIPLTVLAVIAAAGLLAPLLARHGPYDQDLLGALQSPSGDHWLGTDEFGRDLFSRILYGSRISLLAVLEGLAVALVAGVPIGLLSGYVGGWLDNATSRMVDGLLSLPPLILALTIVGILGPGLSNAMIAIGIVFSPRFFRIARAAANSIRHAPYIEAARCLGCSQARIIVRHVLPNASGPLIVQATFSAGLILIAEASLSFLGLGVQAPEASWGSMVKAGFDVVRDSSSQMYPPALMIVVTILCCFKLGDALRDRLARGRQ